MCYKRFVRSGAARDLLLQLRGANLVLHRSIAVDYYETGMDSSKYTGHDPVRVDIRCC